MQKTTRIAAALFFVFSGLILLIDQKPVDAQEQQLIRIMGGVATGANELKKPITIEPANLTVSKGAVVTWLNWSRNSDCVQVSFEDGKKCDDGSDAPSGFSMRTDGCYVTSWISFGGTSSLHFTEPGSFTYTVEAKTGGEVRKETGRIVVVAQ
jgi:plastocyanin